MQSEFSHAPSLPRQRWGGTLLRLVAGVLLIFVGTFVVSVLKNDVFSGRGFEISQYATFSTWKSMFFTPLGVLGFTCLYMLFECLCLGFQNSSLARVLNWETDESVQDDLFYFVLSVSSLGYLLMALSTLGFGYWVHSLVLRSYGVSLAGGLPKVPQFFVLLFVFTFLSYWQHRMVHRGAFWHLHKVHHAATSLNLLTPQRNHPLNVVVVHLTESLPIALLGFDPGVYLAFRILNSLYQISVHSHLDWGGEFVRKYLFITPAMHWIHHSDNPKHWDTNFGILSLWDRLFGTLYLPTQEELAQISFGVGKDPLHNAPGRIRNMAEIYAEFFKHLFSSLRLSR